MRSKKAKRSLLSEGAREEAALALIPNGDVRTRRNIKERATFLISRAVHDDIRDAVYYLQGTGAMREITLSRVTEEALRSYLKDLMKRYNNNQPFPARVREREEHPSTRVNGS
jgi:hypothetical protein